MLNANGRDVIFSGMGASLAGTGQITNDDFDTEIINHTDSTAPNFVTERA